MSQFRFHQPQLLSFVLVGLGVAIAPQVSLLKVQPPTVRASEKITFDISHISPNGVSGGRSLSYEFCIPATDEHLTEVLAIDPTIYHFRHSRGRIGCQRDQYLCIGSTHDERWREILLAIANLDYVQRIDEFFGE